MNFRPSRSDSPEVKTHPEWMDVDDEESMKVVETIEDLKDETTNTTEDEEHDEDEDEDEDQAGECDHQHASPMEVDDDESKKVVENSIEDLKDETTDATEDEPVDEDESVSKTPAQELVLSPPQPAPQVAESQDDVCNALSPPHPEWMDVDDEESKKPVENAIAVTHAPIQSMELDDEDLYHETTNATVDEATTAAVDEDESVSKTTALQLVLSPPQPAPQVAESQDDVTNALSPPHTEHQVEETQDDVSNALSPEALSPSHTDHQEKVDVTTADEPVDEDESVSDAHTPEVALSPPQVAHSNISLDTTSVVSDHKSSEVSQTGAHARAASVGAPPQRSAGVWVRAGRQKNVDSLCVCVCVLSGCR